MVDSKATLQIPGFVLVFIGAILNFIALATPAWQVCFLFLIFSTISNFEDLKERLKSINLQMFFQLSTELFFQFLFFFLQDLLY